MGRPSKPSKRRAASKSRRGGKNTNGRPSGKAAHAATVVIPAVVSALSNLSRTDEVRRAPLKVTRTKTILLLQGINTLTGRPIRVYITPSDRLITCETIGQLDRTGRHRTK